MVTKGNTRTATATQEGSYVTDTGTANNYVVALRPPISTYKEGLELSFKAANANTGASTLAVNGLTAKSIKKDVTSNLAANDILQNEIIHVSYDGTNFQLTRGSGGGSGTSGTSGVDGTAFGTSGTNGTSGTSGANGATGTSGTSGANGAAGTSGVNGTSGTSGSSGITGGGGSSGTSGSGGTSGTSGVNGNTGTSGVNGTSGTSGANGTSGTSGIHGTSGINGANGTSGTSGNSGTSGVNGTAGTSGTSGGTGSSGTSGTSGGGSGSGTSGTSGTSGGAGGSLIFANGLTNTAGTVRLGGINPFTANTFIDTAGFNFSVGTGATMGAGSDHNIQMGLNTIIGPSVQAAVALGYQTEARGSNSMAVNRNGVANGAGSFICGADGNANGNYSFVSGDANDDWGYAGGVFGFGNDEWTYTGFNVGHDNIGGSLSGAGVADQYEASFIWGVQNRTTGNRTLAFGRAVAAIANDAMAIGNGIDATNTRMTVSEAQSLGIGFNSDIPTFMVHKATGAGTYGKTSVYGVLELGAVSKTIGTLIGIDGAPYTVTIADIINTDATNRKYIIDTNGSTGYVVLGDRALGTTVIGMGSTATFRRNIAIGVFSRSTGNFDSVAIGAGPQASNNDTVALGSYAIASGNTASALGAYSQAIGIQSIAIGNQAIAKSAHSIVIGDNSVANNSVGEQAIIIGEGSTANADFCMNLGQFGNVAGQYSVALGYSNTITSGHNNTVVIGRNGVSRASNQVVFGSGTATFTDMFFGAGAAQGLGGNFTCTINGTGGFGLNSFAASLAIAGGRGTGSTAGGTVTIQTAPAGASGSTQNALVDRMKFGASGEVYIFNLTAYADNAAALAAGLTAGQLYRLGDQIGIVH